MSNVRRTDILIVGGGVAGTTAAETYRLGGGTGGILIISDEPHRLYSRVLLPHAIKGKVPAEKVFLRDESFYTRKDIGFLKGRAVLRVDARHRVATLDGGEEVGFDKLVVAPGARPRPWEVPGADLPGVVRLQTYEDIAAVRAAAAGAERLAIVGSGFIGLEFAAIAVASGLEATLLNRGPHFWTSVMDAPMGAAVQALLEAQGVQVRNGTKAVEVTSGVRRQASGVRLSSGVEIPCGMVGVGIGTEVPCEPFGDMKGERGIKTDASLRTIHEGIWAAGDAAEFDDEVLGIRHVVGNWTNAMAQGRHVGKALLGETGKFILLTQYTSSVVPGVNLIFLGETRMRPGVERVARAYDARRLVEFHLLDGRMIGAILLNAADQRAAVAALVQTTDRDFRKHAKELADPSFPLDAFR
jgi:3-phenylpropionate/trans-cinnamate dioxygenase ferredoxin reductase subunit